LSCSNGRTGTVEITALSCGSPGNCVAGGSYTYERVIQGGDTVYPQAFVMTETGGVWGPMEEAPGLRALGPQDSEIAFTSCPATTGDHGRTTGPAHGSHLGCTAIGDYRTKSDSGLFTTST
jgi:hypothetical protein